jgi:phosphoenolpyruvate-protein phosphotransferase (PTS system enzyme I)
MSERLGGIGVTPRSGVGTAYWYGREDRTDEREGGDPTSERERLDRAFESARAGIWETRAAVADRIGEEEASVFDAHEQFLADPTIHEGVDTAVDDGASAEAAV